jgi:Chaperone of endosialidase
MNKIIFTLVLAMMGIGTFGQSVTMTINGAYADSSGNARNSKKLQGKDTTQILAYIKALIATLGMPTCVQGDLLYGSGTNTYSKLAKNTTTGYFLSNSGTSNNPQWNALPTATNSILGIASFGNGLGVTNGNVTVLNINPWVSGTNKITYNITNSSVGIGTTTITSGSKLTIAGGNLDVTGSGNITAVSGTISTFGDISCGGTLSTGSIQSTGDITGTGNFNGSACYLNVSAGSFIEFIDNTSNLTIGSVSNVSGTGVAYNVTSDSTLKENIKNTGFSLKDLMKLKVVDFNFKSDLNKRTSTGFLAQEVYKIYPLAVTKPTKSVDKWQMSREALVPLLVKSIQDQQSEITDLTKRIEKLEKLIK